MRVYDKHGQFIPRAVRLKRANRANLIGDMIIALIIIGILEAVYLTAFKYLY